MKRDDKETDATLQSRLLYIGHLAQALQAKETGRITLCPTAYRLCAKRLREATAGVPETHLAQTLGASYSVISDALENRYFETRGYLPGPGGKAIKRTVDTALGRMRRQGC